MWQVHMYVKWVGTRPNSAGANRNVCTKTYTNTHTSVFLYMCQEVMFKCVAMRCNVISVCVKMSNDYCGSTNDLCASNRLCLRSALLRLLLVINVYEACRKQCCNNTVAEREAFIVIVVALLNQVCLSKFLFDFIYATFYATLLCPSVRLFASRHMLPHPTHLQRLHLRMFICSHTHWYVRPPASDYWAVSTCLWVSLRLRCNYSTCNATIKAKNTLQ